MVDLSTVVLLIVVTVALTVVLVIAVVASKIARDRRESRSSERRRMVAAALESRDQSAIIDACRLAAEGSPVAQADFLSVLQRSVSTWHEDATLAGLVATGYSTSGLRTRVIRQLRSRSSVRRGVAALIAGNPAADVDPMLLRPILSDATPAVRLATAGALECIASPEAADVLIDGLFHGVLPSPRLVERLGHPWAVTAICGALGCDGDDCRHARRCRDDDIRVSLVQALGLASDRAAMPTLLAELARQPNPEVSCQALRAIVRCVAAANKRTRRRVEAIAREALTDPHPRLRTAAIEILAREGYEADLHPIAEAVCDRDWFVRRAAAKALLSFGESGREALAGIAVGSDRYAADRAREELAFEQARRRKVVAT